MIIDESGDASFNHGVNVVGATTMESTLVIAGDTSMNNNLFVGGDLSLNGDLTIQGNLAVFQTKDTMTMNTTVNNYEVIITNDLSLNGDISTSGSATIDGTTTLSSTLTVNGPTTINANFSAFNITGTDLRMSYDVDSGHYLGKAHIGFTGMFDGAGFSHIDRRSITEYALLQNASGMTYLNSASGQSINFRISNDDKAQITSDGDAIFYNNVDVTKATTLSSTLNVTEATTLSSTLNVTEATTLSSTLDVALATTLSSTLDVAGATTLSSTLGVTEATTLSSTLDVALATTLSSTLDVALATTLSSTLDVTEATTLSSTLDVRKATTLSSTLNVSGATSISSTLYASGQIYTSSNIYCSGNLQCVGNLSTSGYTAQIGKAFILYTASTDTVTFSHLSSLSANQVALTQDGSGMTSLQSTSGQPINFRISNDDKAQITSDGDAIFYNNVDVTKATTLSSTLGVTDATTLSSTLDVTDATTLSSTLTVQNDASFNANIQLSGNMGINATPNSTIVFDISSNNAIRLPKGTSGERPVNNGGDASYKGLIRYNTDQDQFEGFGAGNTWGSLGGVKDVDGNTYISAETSAGADNNELQFFTDGNERMRIGAEGDVSFNHGVNIVGATNMDSTLVVGGDVSCNSNLSVQGTTVVYVINTTQTIQF
jgi:hypothetical protein